MSRAATKTGTAKAEAMQISELRRHARRQFQQVGGAVLDVQVRKLHRMAKTGRLRIGPRP